MPHKKYYKKIIHQTTYILYLIVKKSKKTPRKIIYGDKTYNMNKLVIKTKEESQELSRLEAYFKKFPQEKIEIDISNLNLIDASRIAVSYSTDIFIKYPQARIKWVVKDVETKRNILPMMLLNSEVGIADNIELIKVTA